MNLIICMTPLQVLIAEKILEERKDEQFQLIFISERDSEKDRFYFNRLSKKVEKSNYFHVYYKNRIKYLIFILKIKFFLITNYDLVFFANINSTFIHKVLSTVKFKQIVTFDDGMANLVNSSTINSQYIPNFKKILFNMIMGIKIDKENIKENISFHYSIFPRFNDFSKPIVPIYLSDFEFNENNKSNGKRCSFFIGQPIFEMINMKKKDYISLVRYIFEEFNIDYYFPHPREDYKINGINYIETNLILEDYLIKYKGELDLFSFYSSSLITLMNCKNISLTSIFVRDIGMDSNPAIVESYELIKKANIKIIYIG